MKVLLDECVPWPLHRGLAGHDCTTAQRQGWSQDLQNRMRLAVAGQKTAVFLQVTDPIAALHAT